ncbi:response regulator transcription factor [Muricomes intestini]|jgi:DNA-binding response OmpR family regulator|uniref:response regulator transcription factor n=1 Tax=Muricomes intestini TaxID=1796634 RepID=UPI000E894698|nr:DNA-binding response regulator [Lachnospiraceae bacterium]HCR81995.1 DNA-binding response regulator [Lachnospiraceae bacterium]
MSEGKNVLVVDDEKKILEVVSSYLESKAHKVYTADTGSEALDIFNRETIEFVILDLMLPDLSGEEVCTKIRKCSRVPILMLTAKTLEEDMLEGLHMGADDYMIKPFSLKELYARMEAILRRTAESPVPLAARFLWNEGDLSIDFEKVEVKKNGEPISLTPKEWKILSALVKYPQKVFTRDDLLGVAFDVSYEGNDRVIDTHIKNLRKKIEDDPQKPVYVKTVHGLGYRFGDEKQ